MNEFIKEQKIVKYVFDTNKLKRDMKIKVTKENIIEVGYLTDITEDFIFIFSTTNGINTYHIIDSKEVYNGTIKIEIIEE